MDSIIKKIASSKILLDVLIAFEDFLDSNDLYVYKNWFDGEIVEGPIISRYWISVTLKYPYRKMPDPEGAERLVRNGVSVKYKKAKGIKTIPTKYIPKGKRQFISDKKPPPITKNTPPIAIKAL